MRKARYLLIALLFTISTAGASQCEPLRKTGSTDANVDLLLVGGENYDSESAMTEDFEYYVDTDNRGLFDVYPMNVTVDHFNIWYVMGRDGSSTTSGERDPFSEAEYWLNQCEKMDYSVFQSKTRHDNWIGAASTKVARVDGVGEKVDEDNGAVGLIHEWGHLFGKVADEYNYEEGTLAASRPNCAESQSQAEEWWGEMAELSENVGYEEGCKGSENIEAHPGKTIMGDGGHWHYGPVNDRRFLRKITEETGPVTDIAIEDHSVSDEEIELDISWEKASNVVNIKTGGETVEQIFVHGSGEREVTIEKPDSSSYEISLETEKDIEEISEENNVASVEEPENRPPNFPANPIPADEETLQGNDVDLIATYSDPDNDDGTIAFYTGEGEEIGECSTESGEICGTTWDVEPGDNEWYAVSSDGSSETRGPTWSFTVDQPPEITEFKPENGSLVKDNATIGVKVTDQNTEGSELEVTLYNASNDQIIEQGSLESGEWLEAELNDLAPNENYRWYAKVSDGVSEETSEIYEFKTEELEVNFSVNPKNVDITAANGSSEEVSLNIQNKGKEIPELLFNSEKLDLKPTETDLEPGESKTVRLTLQDLNSETGEIEVEASEETETVQVQADLYENYSSKAERLEDELAEIESAGLKNRVQEGINETKTYWRQEDYRAAEESYQEARSFANRNEGNAVSQESSGNDLITMKNVGIAAVVFFIIFTLATSIRFE